MATILGAMTVEDNLHVHAVWTPITQADTGSAMNLVDFPDRTIQVYGTFGTSGAITIQGSMDNATWSTLHDFQGAALVILDSTLHLIAENPRYIRPTATAGSGMTVSVIIEGAR